MNFRFMNETGEGTSLTLDSTHSLTALVSNKLIEVITPTITSLPVVISIRIGY